MSTAKSTHQDIEAITGHYNEIDHLMAYIANEVLMRFYPENSFDVRDDSEQELLENIDAMVAEVGKMAEAAHAFVKARNPQIELSPEEKAVVGRVKQGGLGMASYRLGALLNPDSRDRWCNTHGQLDDCWTVGR